MVIEFFETFKYLFEKIFLFLDSPLLNFLNYSISFLDILIGFFVLYIIVDNFVPKA